MRSPHYVFAQAPPEEKAIVLRDVTESADPLIRQIKVDDVHGADAVRVENGVVRIKVGDLTANGRWVIEQFRCRDGGGSSGCVQAEWVRSVT